MGEETLQLKPLILDEVVGLLTPFVLKHLRLPADGMWSRQVSSLAPRGREKERESARAGE